MTDLQNRMTANKLRQLSTMLEVEFSRCGGVDEDPAEIGRLISRIQQASKNLDALAHAYLNGKRS